MDAGVKAALAYVQHWLAHHVRLTQQPGCAIAVAHKGRVVLERAYGHADLIKGRKLTPRHRFRAASHSKSFTAAGIMLLRERGLLRLDDPVGQYVDRLHPQVAETTIAQALSHSAGLIRDGVDAGQWQDRRPFANERDLRRALAGPLVIDASTRFKNSNHGFGLIGLVMEAITGERYVDWITREVIAASKLTETTPDVPAAKGGPMARGHSGRLPLGRRVVIPGDNPTHALAPAAGFVSTAADLARFFASLDPAASRSILTPASRREMVRRHWRDDQSSIGQHYGLGITIGRTGDWDWFGHGGGFQSCLSRTIVLPGRDLSVSVLTNAVDGFANPWSDSVINILRFFAARGAPTAKTRDWTGRWWRLWGPVDLVPVRDHAVVAWPGMFNPFMDASEIEITGRDRGRLRRGSGFGSPGEPVRLVRNANGNVSDVWLGGTKYVSEARAAAELKRNYEG